MPKTEMAALPPRIHYLFFFPFDFAAFFLAAIDITARSFPWCAYNRAARKSI